MRVMSDEFREIVRGWPNDTLEQLTERIMTLGAYLLRCNQPPTPAEHRTVEALLAHRQTLQTGMPDTIVGLLGGTGAP